MQAVILVAGKGTRMKHLTESLPKPMLKINNKPILEYKLDSLPDEIDEVVLVVGYKKEIITEYFGNNYKGLNIIYVEQVELNGTAGALKLTEKYLKDKFLVLMGDDLYKKEDLNKLLNYDFAVLTYKTKNAQQFGLVKTDDGKNLVDIIERPHNEKIGLVNIGAYVISQPYFKKEMVSISDTEYGLPQTLVSMKDEYKVRILETKNWQPIGSPSDLDKAKNIIQNF